MNMDIVFKTIKSSPNIDKMVVFDLMDYRVKWIAKSIENDYGGVFISIRLYFLE